MTNQKLRIKYVIPDSLRDLYVNGAWGGTTTTGRIHMHFYAERQPIPKSLEYTVTDQGIDAASEEVEQGGDVVRLVQTSVIMDYQTAVAIQQWLTAMIKKIEVMAGAGGEKTPD